MKERSVNKLVFWIILFIYETRQLDLPNSLLAFVIYLILFFDRECFFFCASAAVMRWLLTDVNSIAHVQECTTTRRSRSASF